MNASPPTLFLQGSTSLLHFWLLCLWAVQRWGEWRSWSANSNLSPPLVPPPHLFPCFSEVSLLWDIDLHKLLQCGSYPQATSSVCALHRLRVHLLLNGVLHRLQMDLGSTTSYMDCWWTGCPHHDLNANFCSGPKVPAPPRSVLAWISAGAFLWIISFLCHSKLPCVACWLFLNTLYERYHPLSWFRQIWEKTPI